MYRLNIVGCPLILLVSLLILSNCARPQSDKSAQPGSNTTGKDLSENAGRQYKDVAVDSGKVAVSYSFAKNQFTLHEPVILEFAVRNGLAEPVKLDLGEDDLLFSGTQPDGSPIQMSRTRIRDGISRWFISSLNAGQTYRHDVVLNEWFDFPALGRYEIVAQLDKHPGTKTDLSIVSDTEFHGEFEITPRDAKQLERLCADLLPHIAGVTNYEEASDAAYTLSHIKDPVAVPYLDKALSTNRMIDSIVVPGLARIGGDEATNALISALKTQHRQTVRELIRPALVRISFESSDPALKEKIKRALST